MRPPPAYAWILAPLALGLLYAAGYALLAPSPSLADLPPSDAILVHRVHGLDLYDQTAPGPRGPDRPPPREALGRERNDPGLVGVDAGEWLHLILMPRSGLQDSTMAVFRLSDPAAFEREFMRTDFLERGLIRQAQHLALRGSWAAVGPQRDATRRLGTGGITCGERGEDWSMAARVPALVDHALGLAREYPWHDVLAAIGVLVDDAELRRDPGSGALHAVLRGDQRIERLREAWSTARLWAWHTQGRVQVELEPRAGSAVAEVLAALPGADPRREDQKPRDAALQAPPPPPGAEGWLWVPYGAERAALARVLGCCGVQFVAPGEGVDPLAGLGAAEPRGGLLAWGEGHTGTGYAWTIGLAAHGLLPELAPFLPLPPAGAASVELPPGVAPLLTGDTGTERAPVGGTVERRQGAAGQVVAFGPSARAALDGFLSAEAAGQLRFPDARDPWGASLPPAPVLARFFLARARAEQVLGRALRPGGMLAMLAGGDVHGVLELRDGRLALRAWVQR